jgi:hypothetical protein
VTCIVFCLNSQCDPHPLHMRPGANARSVYTSRTGTPKNIETTVARGRALWSSIYEPHADKLHAKLGSYHPDFIGR